MVLEPISFGIGTTIGLAGIALAFKGIIDTYNLFDTIVAKDNGSKFLALQYHVERQKLLIWGDEHRPGDEGLSPLAQESRATKMIIAGTLAEIRATHELAEKILGKIKMQESYSGAINYDGDISLDSNDVVKLQAIRNSKKQEKTIVWAIKDKAKFMEIVERMKALVNDLYSLTRISDTQALAKTLCAYLLPQLKDTFTLSTLQQKEQDFDPLLVLSARIKQLQNESGSEASPDAQLLRLGNDFELESQSVDLERTFGHTEQPDQLSQRGWVEWKTVSKDLLPHDAKESLRRMKALTTLLCTANTKYFDIPPCLGLLQPETRVHSSRLDQRYGFVFRWPDGDFDQTVKPNSLLDLIKGETAIVMPLLNHRFAIAYSLASTLSLLHACRWIHKGFRSDHVLFFTNKSEGLVFEKPLISGFEFSRPEGNFSIDNRPVGDPDLDLYYHEDVVMQGSSRMTDIYSLGVVLFEVALWSPLSEDVDDITEKSVSSMTLREVRNYLLRSISVLGAQVGAKYQNAVRWCLEGAFEHDEGEDQGEQLSRAFFVKVLQPLQACMV